MVSLERNNHDGSWRLSLAFSVLLVFGVCLYNSLSSAFRIEHVSAYYRYFNLLLSMLVYFSFAIEVAEGLCLKHLALLWIGVGIVIILSYFVLGVGDESATTEFIYFCIWGLSSLFAGFLFYDKSRIAFLLKQVDLIWPILTAGSLLYLLRIASGEWVASDSTGLGYQSVSYYSALAFGLTSFSAFFSDKTNSYGWSRSIAFRVLALLSLITQFLCALFSGGRGGLLTIIIIMLYLLFLYSKSDNSVITKMMLLCVLTLSLFWLSRLVMDFSFLGTWRLFLASGRENVYRIALQAIKERPLLGYGFFGYVHLLENYRYPHNLILQLLLSCGSIGTILLFFTAPLLCDRFRFIESGTRVFIAIVLLYCTVRLMFSGSFLYETLLWFVIGVLANYRKGEREDVGSYNER